MDEKRSIRLHIRDTFQNMTDGEMRQKSRNVYKRLFNSDIWKHASSVAVTMSTRNEINTRPLIEKGWQEGKRIGIPKADPVHYSLDFYEIASFQETKEDFAGILEPDPKHALYLTPDIFDIVIVPGMAFDRKKYRIGFGGGFYDRFLKNISAPTCAVLYDFQLFHRLPREDHDIPLNYLFTETSSF